LDEARRLGIRGWVRNRPDGKVELVAEGAKREVEKLIAWCHHGPPGALVQRVQVQWEEPLLDESDFFIRH
jgi:acylphosphatase